ncbi:MAG: PEP-CTERM sorting domain-containing protein [Planctomycetia bacterium]|nr:PEP-CTERM sorting domain-containing protein [Planctomycetia bacterium]
MQELGALEGGDWSRARAINNLGEVVGEVGFGLNETRAFIWDAENGMRPLESAQGTLRGAYDINDAGQIVGLGRNPDGQDRAFLLTPIPEPATAALLISGLLALAALGRRKGRTR